MDKRDADGERALARLHIKRYGTYSRRPVHTTQSNNEKCAGRSYLAKAANVERSLSPHFVSFFRTTQRLRIWLRCVVTCLCAEVTRNLGISTHFCQISVNIIRFPAEKAFQPLSAISYEALSIVKYSSWIARWS